MSFEFFKRALDKIVNETKQYDTVTFAGMGEPLLDETLDRKIDYAKKKKIKNVFIVSNGSMLSVKRFKELEAAKVTSVRVSVYGVDQNSYSKMHGVDSAGLFERIRASLVAISRIKRKTKLILTFNSVPGRNDDCLQAWVSYWKDKVDLVEVWRPHNWVDGKECRRVQRKKRSTCGRPFNGPLQVQADGTVNMCCFDFDGKLTLGDLRTQSLGEIFDSPFFKKIKECHRTGDFKESALICRECDQRNFDKSDVMIYNSRFDISRRVQTLSTTYKEFAQPW